LPSGFVSESIRSSPWNKRQVVDVDIDVDEFSAASGQQQLGKQLRFSRLPFS
jgi:hypothetical protein